MGEYAQLLTTASPTGVDGDSDGDNGSSGLPSPAVSEVVDCMHRLIQDPTNSTATHHYALNALVKMSARIPAEAERIRNIVGFVAKGEESGGGWGQGRWWGAGE